MIEQGTFLISYFHQPFGHPIYSEIVQMSEQNALEKGWENAPPNLGADECYYYSLRYMS